MFKPTLKIGVLLISFFSTLVFADEQSNRLAPECALSNLDATQQYAIQHFKGKVVYLDFWASWCGPCVESFPFMNSLHKDFKAQGLQVLAVNLDENREDATNFVSKRPPEFLVAADDNANCAKAFDVKAMPSTFLIDRQGMIRAINYGFRAGEAKEFRGKVEQLLAEPAK